jgi:hypothetical protein
MKLRFPYTRERPQAGDPPPAITVQLSGPLASTPLGACVEEGLNKVARATPVQSEFSGGTVSFRRVFPLKADAAK